MYRIFNKAPKMSEIEYDEIVQYCACSLYEMGQREC